jgi:hypothetical protein
MRVTSRTKSADNLAQYIAASRSPVIGNLCNAPIDAQTAEQPHEPL